MRLEVPLTCDPVPQILVSGKPVATIPESAAFKSSVKAKPLAANPLPVLLMVNRIVLVLDPLKELGTNALVKVGASDTMASCALAAATGATSMLASVLVVFV